MSPYSPSTGIGAFRQGEIFSELVEVRLVATSIIPGNGEHELEEREHPYGVLVTQDCDLDWDYQARNAVDPAVRARLQSKLLPNLLFCELWSADLLRGTQGLASDLWKRVRQNQDERYHWLPELSADADAFAMGIPPLAIDFKRVFTIPTEEMYARIKRETKRRALLQGPFMQDLSNRFAYYHLRVALPSV